MTVAILGLITLVLTVGWGIFNYMTNDRKKKEDAWNDFRTLEKEYREALAAGDPVRASVLDVLMRQRREKYAYLRTDRK